MHGRRFYRFCCAVSFVLAGVSGCADSSAAPPGRCAARRDADAAGCIEGQVVWAGDPPSAARFSYRLPAGSGDEASDRLRVNPFVPAIDSRSGGVAGAVVYLRGVDGNRARPWDHPPVSVEQRDYQLHVFQGGRDGRIGFVRRCDCVEMVSRDRHFHSLRAQGPARFTLAFPDPDCALSRPLAEAGVVELSSGAGHYWMRAYLFVDDHPYYALTEGDGHFALTRVPPGRYEIVCWVPNWRETGHDRDPETGCVTRLSFAQPATIEQTVEVRARQTRDVHLELSARDFDRSDTYVKR